MADSNLENRYSWQLSDKTIMADSYQIINSMADPHQKKKTGPSDENRIADSN